MNIFKSIQSSLARYFVFTGRSTRSDYWYFLLFVVILILGAFEIDNNFRQLRLLIYIPFLQEYISSGLVLVVHIFFFLPFLALCVRRLRDIGESGWWMLLFYPFINPIVSIDTFAPFWDAKIIFLTYLLLCWEIWWLGFRKGN